ncbi:MAG: TetR/AcrR family transcriptional regulator [Pseudomonadota bacterium]
MPKCAPKFSRRKDARPGELVEAARHEFIEHGYGDAKLARIAKRAGVSNGTLYHYFNDKAELFGAVFRAAFVDPMTEGAQPVPQEAPSDPLLFALDRLFEDDKIALLSILLFEAQRYPDPVGSTANFVLKTVEEALVVYLRSADLPPYNIPKFPLTLISQSLGLAIMERARGEADWANISRSAIREQLTKLKE